MVEAEAFRPEVVLLDIGLPRLDGYEVAQHIRQQPWGQGMVLIALTGWGQDSDRQRSQAAGFDHHLVKPVHSAILMPLLAALPAPPKSTAHGVSANRLHGFERFKARSALLVIQVY